MLASREQPMTNGKPMLYAAACALLFACSDGPKAAPPVQPGASAPTAPSATTHRPSPSPPRDQDGLNRIVESKDGKTKQLHVDYAHVRVS